MLTTSMATLSPFVKDRKSSSLKAQDGKVLKLPT
jgi:hypothetical protein